MYLVFLFLNLICELFLGLHVIMIHILSKKIINTQNMFKVVKITVNACLLKALTL